MTILLATATLDARKFYLRGLGGLPFIPGTPTNTATNVWDHRIKFFRAGEGGWVLSGMTQVRRLPDEDLRRYDNLVQDIDARVDTTRAGAGQPERYEGNTASADYSRGFFQKTLAAGAVTALSDRRIQVDCLIDADEFPEDATGSGREPVIWELGLFADHPTVAGESLMVGYGTFALGVTKRPGEQLPIRVYITL